MLSLTDRIVIIVSGATLIFLLGICIVILNQIRRSTTTARPLFISYIILFLGIFSIPSGLILQILNRNEVIHIDASLNIITFALYLTLLLVGNNYLFNKIIKLPSNRTYFIQTFNRNMAIVYILTIIGILRNIGFLNDVIMYTRIEESLLFIVLTLGSILLLLFYNKWLDVEIKQNGSKLLKMRLSLVRYFVIGQILTVLVIFTLSVYLLVLIFNNPQEEIVAIYRLILNSVFILSSLISGTILWISTTLPNTFRKRFDLDQNRFRSTLRLNKLLGEKSP